MNVCLLAAGRGTRMGPFSARFHKALLPLGNRAVLSRIIESFGKNHRFVIATGYLHEQIENYIKIAHPELNVVFVPVDNFDGPGSGPGYSLLQCAPELEEPFYFCACDSYIDVVPTETGTNWVGVTQAENIQKWCSVEVDASNKVRAIYYKVDAPTDLAFVGLAFVKNTKAFWSAFLGDATLLGGEIQVDNGLKGLIPLGLAAIPVKWMDTGTEENYRLATTHFDKNYSFSGKTTDITYRIGDRIIKYFPDPDTALYRYQRGMQNGGVFADTLEHFPGFYSYRYTEGCLLSSVLNAVECDKFLEWAQTRLWKSLSPDKSEFARETKSFYIDKTLRRIADFAQGEAMKLELSPQTINGLICRPASQLVPLFSEELASNALASTYHGDLHADNIIKSKEDYVLIDWRDRFGSLIAMGDRYYDLAKFLHTLEFSVETMERRNFEVKIGPEPSTFQIDHQCRFNELQAQRAFWEFVGRHGYNALQIRVLNAIVYLNMASLYDAELGLYLYLLGRYQLQIEYHETR